MEEYYRLTGTMPEADQTEQEEDDAAYFSAKEEDRDDPRPLSSRLQLHHIANQYSGEANHDVMEMLASLSLVQTAALPPDVRHKVEVFRADRIERLSDAAQFQNQRNSGNYNPGKLYEPPKKVSFGGAQPKGACSAHLRGQCHKQLGTGPGMCPWSHDPTICRAARAEITEYQLTADAEEAASSRSRSPARAPVAAMSSANNSQQAVPAPGAIPRRTSSPADNSQEE